MIEIQPDDISLVQTSIEPEVESSNLNAVVDGQDIDIIVEKREFNVVGDDVYIGRTLQEMPMWLNNYLNTTTSLALDQKISEINQLTETVNSLVTAMNVAKNAYEQAVIQYSDFETILNARIETLNSSMQNAYANIIDIVSTKVTDDEASSTALNVLTAQKNSTDTGTLGATLTNLNTAIATESEARATSTDAIMSVLTDPDTGLQSNASAIESMQTYVGIDSAGASTNTGLSAYLEGADGSIGGADSNVANLVYTDAQGNIKSKWEYNSNININGVNYPSGFGMKIDGENSEYWINADKFRFTNTANATPISDPVFSIDTEDGNKVQFNGIVKFGNSTIDSTGGTSTIDGNSIATGYIDAARINTNGLVADDIKGDTISGKYITASTIEGSIIRSSFIDFSNSQFLTNWKQYTESTIPTAYIDNFAHNTDGTLVTTDTEKYVRLVGNNRIFMTGNTQSDRATATPYTIPLYSYDSYKINTLMRVVSHSPNISFNDTPGKIKFLYITASSPYATRGDIILADFTIYGDNFKVRMQSHHGGGFLSYNGTIEKNGVFIYSTGDVLCYANDTGCSSHDFSTSITVGGIIIDIILKAPVGVVGTASFSVVSREVYNSLYITLTNYYGKSDPFFTLHSASSYTSNGLHGISVNVPYATVTS